MHQRDAVRAAWAEAGLYESKDPKLREFLKRFDEAPADCWPQVAETVRALFPEHIEKLVLPLWKTGDKLLRVNILKFADLESKGERALIAKLVPGLDPVEDRHELAAAIHQGSREVLETVLKRKNLPEHFRLLAQHRRAAFG